MGYVYLIGEINNDNHYKIGVTKNNIETRKKKLQTGNSNELYIVNEYQTDYPFKLEKMLHNHYKNDNIINEWFELNNEELHKFKELCDKYNNIILSLKDNPFFNKKKP